MIVLTHCSQSCLVGRACPPTSHPHYCSQSHTVYHCPSVASAGLTAISAPSLVYKFVVSFRLSPPLHSSRFILLPTPFGSTFTPFTHYLSFILNITPRLLPPAQRCVAGSLLLSTPCPHSCFQLLLVPNILAFTSMLSAPAFSIPSYRLGHFFHF